MPLERWKSWSKRGVAEAAAVLLLLALYAAMKTYCVRPTMTDDWIYAYLARRIGEGAWPYKDFFFAHPPMHLLAMVPFLKLFGETIATIRLMPALATLLSGVFLWRIVRRDHGAVAGVVALATFLTALDVLRASTHVTGTNLSLAALIVGTWAFLRGRGLLGGVVTGLGSLVALYIGPLVAFLLALMAWRRMPGWRRAWIGFAATFIGIQLIVAAPAPGSYLLGVYRYHSMKLENREKSEESWDRALAYQALGCAALPILLAGIAGEAWRARGPNPRSGKRPAKEQHRRETSEGGEGTVTREGARRRLRWQLALAGLIAIELLFLLSLKEMYTYYLLPLLALVAVALGVGLVSVARTARALIAHRERGVLLAGSFALLVLLIGVEALRTKETSFIRTSYERTYAWVPGVSPTLDGIVRPLFWRDHRRAGSGYLTLTRALWHETDQIFGADTLAAILRRDAAPTDRIVGDSHLAPLLAFTTGMRIIDDEADTNTKRFSSGVEKIDRFIARIDRPELVWVVTVEETYIDAIPTFRRWRTENFEPVVRLRQPDGEILNLSRRKGT